MWTFFSASTLVCVRTQSRVHISAFICSHPLSCHVRGLTLSDAPDSTNHHTAPPCRTLSGAPCALQMSHNVFTLWFFNVELLLSCCLSPRRHIESRRQAHPDEILQWAIHYHQVLWLQHAFMALSVVHIYMLCMWLSNLANSRKQCSIR